MSPTESAASPPSIVKMLDNNVRWQVIDALTRSDYRVQELASLVNQPFNLVSYHLRQLRDSGLVDERRSSADGRDIYYSLNQEHFQRAFLETAEALHLSLAASAGKDTRATEDPPVRRPSVLILCTHNSARSQLAEGIMRSLGDGTVEVFSAGSQPTSVHPDAVATAAKYGIEISGRRSKSMDEFKDRHFDYVITVCDRIREVCPNFPDDPERIHWSFADPATVEDPDERRRAFDRTFVEMMTRVRYMLTLIQRERA